MLAKATWPSPNRQCRIGRHGGRPQARPISVRPGCCGSVARKRDAHIVVTSTRRILLGAPHQPEWTKPGSTCGRDSGEYRSTAGPAGYAGQRSWTTSRPTYTRESADGSGKPVMAAGGGKPSTPVGVVTVPSGVVTVPRRVCLRSPGIAFAVRPSPLPAIRLIG